MMARAMASSLMVSFWIIPQMPTIRSSRTSGAGLLNLRINPTAPVRSAQQCRAAATLANGTATAGWQEAVAKDSGLLAYIREKSMFAILTYLENCSLGGEGEKLEGITAGIIGAALILLLTFSSASLAGAAEGTGLKPYCGIAASASSYGGYGGNTNKQTTAEYKFDVPEEWKEKVITKIEKGTNGSDAEFDNPKHKEEKVYVTYLAGLRGLAPIERVLDNLALSDPSLAGHNCLCRWECESCRAEGSKWAAKL